MKIELWKKTECQVQGCVEDDSESRSYKVEFYLIRETEADEFGEERASDYGDQDYGYQVSYNLLATFSEEINGIVRAR